MLKCTSKKKLCRYEYYSVKPSNVLARQFFGENLPDLNVLAYNTSLQLVNTHFSVNSVRPLVPNVVEVAGLHIQKSHKVNEVPKANIHAYNNFKKRFDLFLVF